MKIRAVPLTLALAAVAVVILLPADADAAGLNGLHDACLETELKGCTVLSSGYIGPDFGDRLAFQTQAGFTDDDGVKGGVVVFTQDEAGWSLLLSAFDAYRYDMPRLVEHEETYLHVPGYSGGTGAYNADLLLVRRDTGAARYIERWQRVDLDRWLTAIDQLLPEGLEIWKGVDYDFGDWFYGALDAHTPLWRTDDGNCCPSGGWATINFTIDDHALVATAVDYLPPAQAQ